MSQKSLDGVKSPRPGGGLGVQRARSMGLLGTMPLEQEVEVSVFDGNRLQRQRSPRSPRPASSQPNRPAGLPVQRGRVLDTDGEDPNPGTARSRSPTYEVSENWMAYAAPKDSETPASARQRCMTAELTPSANFSCRMRRQHSGKINQESENWAPARSDFAAEPAPPPLIANSVTHILSKGKKTNLPKGPDEAKRRLKMDASQPESRRSERKHNFPDAPQSQRQLEEFKSSPRLLTMPPRKPDANVEDGRPCIIDVQHRSSAEMAASMYPERVENPSLEQRKYMVGSEIIS